MLHKDLVDRQEFSTRDGRFVEEYIAVDCPHCGTTSNSIVTGKNNTWYVHGETFCTVQRGREFIPDHIMYYQLRQGDHSDVNISCSVRHW